MVPFFVLVLVSGVCIFCYCKNFLGWLLDDEEVKEVEVEIEDDKKIKK